MKISKAERLTNLVIGLLSTRQFVTADRIRATFAGYQDCTTQESFSRMFERDKAELRDLGIPLATGSASGMSEAVGYRIDRSEYELPAISLSQQESAAVALAGQLWRTPEMSSAFAGALMKLRAAGIRVDDSDPTTVIGGLGASPDPEPAVAGLIAAVDAGTAVEFTHLAASTGTRTVRTVEPWAVITNRGNWYLVGHDRDRDATRIFRVSRITGDIRRTGSAGTVRVPEDVDPRALVEAATAEPTSPGVATLWLADGHAHELRRASTLVTRRPLDGRAGSVVEVPIGPRGSTVRTIAGHGPDAVVLAPEDLRREVLDVLGAAARAHAAPTARTAHPAPGSGTAATNARRGGDQEDER